MTSNSNECRVCGSSTRDFARKKILKKYDVAYFQCTSCGHIQSEQPYWLEEAYTGLSFKRDTGMVDRSVWTAKAVVALAYKRDLSSETPMLDWGAGTGMFVRLCRDHGLNYFYSDRYAANIFALGFEAPALEKNRYKVISAFEVAEHFPDPLADFAQILDLSPDYFIFSTLLYKDQGPGWWYVLEDGQHVAFYTRKSLEIIAHKHGYHLATDDCGTHLFSRIKIGDRLVHSLCKASKRDRWSAKYRKKNGSRLVSDYESIARQMSTPDAQ